MGKNNIFKTHGNGLSSVILHQHQRDGGNIMIPSNIEFEKASRVATVQAEPNNVDSHSDLCSRLYDSRVYVSLQQQQIENIDFDRHLIVAKYNGR